jgi:hypothetical protein
VVTNNVGDFRPLAADWLASGRLHPGLILLPASPVRTRSASAGLARAIAALMRDNRGGLDGVERWM